MIDISIVDVINIKVDELLQTDGGFLAGGVLTIRCTSLSDVC